MVETGLIVILTFIVGFAAGKWQANKAKNDEELADPTVYVIERKLYWLENINRAYNKIQEIFDENKDKFECLKLEHEESHIIATSSIADTGQLETSTSSR